MSWCVIQVERRCASRRERTAENSECGRLTIAEKELFIAAGYIIIRSFVPQRTLMTRSIICYRMIDWTWHDKQGYQRSDTIQSETDWDDEVDSEDLQMKGSVILCNERELAEENKNAQTTAETQKHAQAAATPHQIVIKPRDSKTKKINATFSFNNAMQSVNRKKAEISS